MDFGYKISDPRLWAGNDPISEDNCSPTSLWSLETTEIKKMVSCIHILCFCWIRNLTDVPNMDYHKISDPRLQRHRRKIFFRNSEKYRTDVDCLHFWSGLDQNCENDAFLTVKLWAIPLINPFTPRMVQICTKFGCRYLNNQKELDEKLYQFLM